MTIISNNLVGPHGHERQISVPLDQQGHIAHKVVSDGVEFVRGKYDLFLSFILFFSFFFLNQAS